MALVNANIAAPINAALALNVASDSSVTIANAQQYAAINQGLWQVTRMTGTYTRRVSRQEAETQAVEHLPDRAAMSPINADLALPIN